MPRAAKTGTPGLYARHTSAGVVYWLTYQGPDGRVFERGGTDKRVAAKMLVSRKAAVLRGDWRPLASARAATGTATGEQTVRSYAQGWHKGRVDADVKTARDEWQRLRDYVFPVLGDRPLGDVTREEVVSLMAAVATSPRLANDEKPNASPPAPRTVHRIYEALRQMFSDAARAKDIAENPCTLRVPRGKGKGELPKKVDADKAWRKSAVFTRDEVEALISDARVPLHRRVLYALLLLTGMRIGEVAGRRWRDYDTKTRPLGKFSVDSQYTDEALKTETPRQVPVHATLAAILAEWKISGFPVLHGHHPQPDEFIVPKLRGGGPQDKRRVWHNLQTDLELLGLRPRRVHDTRRSFITLALHDGARERYLKKVTHDGKGESAFDDYDAADWADLCAAVACLQVERRSVAAVVTLRAAAGA